jgi:WD40 repeat protein
VHFAAAAGTRVRVWDAGSGDLTAQARPLESFITAADFSHDGDHLVVSDRSGRVAVLDADDLGTVGHVVRFATPVSNLAAGPSGDVAVVLTGSRGPSDFWSGSSSHWSLVDLASGTTLREGDLGFDAGLLDFSPDGQHVAIAGQGGVLVVLDLATGEQVREPVAAHDSVVAVTYSPDGSRVLTSGDDATNGLWDGDTGELLARVVTPHRFTEAGFESDPHDVLIAPLWGGAVFRWDTDPDRAIAFACRAAGRDLSEAEWSEVFGDTPFRQTCPSADREPA